MPIRLRSLTLGSAALCAALLLFAPVLRAAAPSWEPSVYPEDQLFPSFLISTATAGAPEDTDEVWDCPQIGDVQGVIGALVHHVRKGDHVRVVVKANELMAESAFEGEAPKKAADLLVHPKIKYRYDQLAKVRQTRPLNLSIETWVNGESLGEQTETVVVRSLNECLYGVVNEDDEIEYDANWNFAAYVNESHPLVDEILREALDTGAVSAFTGYQSGKSEQVLLQIYAIWNVMQRRGLRYSNVTTTAVESEFVLSQHVRLLDQSLQARQANCVDGSVLLASVLRKIGLRCYLALEPEHMFLAVDLDDDTIVGIETTMMGENDLGEFDALTKVSKKKRETLKNQASFKTFEAAVDAGTKELETHLHDFEKEDFEYQLVDIAQARAQGILPIGFTP